MAHKTLDEPTPNGGVKSTLFYLDAAGNETTEAAAVQLLIVEYDAAGKAIHRTYAPAPARA
ncbi:MAG TPA: hypothetical protein VD866_19275 [Urbifossiella sp.]|nr:hypothetical protein [Urbifossiella sp.]